MPVSSKRLEETLQKHNEKLQDHGESIAVLKSIASDINEGLKSVEKNLNDMTSEYLKMQGTLVSFVDMKEQINKIDEKAEIRFLSLEKSFLEYKSVEKGKRIAIAGFIAVVTSIFTGTIVGLIIKFIKL